MSKRKKLPWRQARDNRRMLMGTMTAPPVEVSDSGMIFEFKGHRFVMGTNGEVRVYEPPRG